MKAWLVKCQYIFASGCHLVNIMFIRHICLRFFIIARFKGASARRRQQRPDPEFACVRAEMLSAQRTAKQFVTM
jgi:hypothetical protein